MKMIDSDKVQPIKDLLSEEYKYNLFDNIVIIPFHRFKNTFRDIWHKHSTKIQRFKRGYSWSDVWNMSDWFVDIIKPMLEYYLNHHYGYPGEITNEEWESIIREMVNSLNYMEYDRARQHLNIQDNDCSLDSCRKVNDFMDTNKNRFFELFSKWFFYFDD